ncbi:restriction endonuclease [Streptomyces sp. NPDC015232]|uniref:restriction endonuclease n=1 Tax=unclassified Streptomyces TaxID=2593676 RepID=UPI0036F6F7E2
MIIDRNAGVTPNRYESSVLRRTIGRRIGRADRDDMLRALLWVSEVRLAGDLVAAWRQLHQELDRETHEAQLRRDGQPWQWWDQVGVSSRAAAKDLTEKLSAERYEAQEALKECERVAEKLAHRLGTHHSDDLIVLRTVLSVLNGQLQSAKKRLSDLMSTDRDELHRLAELEQRRRAGTGTTIEQLDKMEQSDFDRVIQQALERSGFTIVTAEPKVLEVAREAFKSIVFCDHAKRPASEQATDIEAIVAAQRFALERGYSSVLVVSNLRFISHPAHRLTESSQPGVEMIQRYDLQRWIEWGEHFDDVAVWA